MSSNYDKIREDNILEYGQGTRHLSFLGRLYTDRTHFVFELLQNAEDAGATRILFNLFDDRLEVTHDGRLFDERDVRGICGVGEGTKTEDLTQIGKFGIGFKSVYAYTTTPEIHSGGEGFRIKHYVRPYAVPSRPTGNSWTTLFVFPFDSDEISSETAYKEISARLRNLSSTTLLFLRKINKIEYRLPNSTGGGYLREEIERGLARQVRIIGQNNGKDEKENWLIFQRPVAVPGKSETVRVEVSFRLEEEDTVAKNPERIIKVKDSPLVVYFPTEKVTRFGFLIQGPYRTTPSRDNIPKDDEWNETLVKETSELIGDIMSEIKDLGLLSVSFLEVLPIRTEDFPDDSMFYPIVESVRNALIEEELLPADDGSFISARNAKLARGAALIKLLSQVQLGQLFQSPAITKWLAKEITQDRTPDLRSYLMNELEVKEVTPNGLAKEISPSFLSSQSDEWFIDFYGYLSGQEALWRLGSAGILRSRPFLRLDNGSQEVPFKADGETPKVFLPPPEETAFPVVKRSIVKDEKACTFLKRLGLSEPDVFDDIVERVLPKYTETGVDSVPNTEHQADLRKIVRAMGSDSEAGKRKVIQAARQTPFLKATNPSGDTIFKKPTEIYLNTEELQRYFSGVQEVWFLHDEYASSDIDINVWQNLGVSDLPKVIHSKTNLGYLSWMVSEGYSHSIEDIDLDGLENALGQVFHLPTFGEQLEQCALIWKILVRVLEEIPELFRAEYKWHHYHWKRKYIDSKVINQLRISAWIPTHEGSLEKPGEITTDQLLEEFSGATKLIESLGIVESAYQSEEERKREHASELGVSLDDIELVKNHPDEFEQFKASLAARKERPTFPTRPVPNPERRQERLGEQLSDVPDKKYDKRERSVRTTSGAIDPVTWLRNQYTNETDQMVCQICKKEMPFRKRDGTHYFEKKEILSRKYLQKEHEAQYLALCPLCAAKYEEFIKTNDDLMGELREAILRAEDYEIPISLGDDKTSIRFVETHYHDLKAIIEGLE